MSRIGRIYKRSSKSFQGAGNARGKVLFILNHLEVTMLIMEERRDLAGE